MNRNPTPREIFDNPDLAFLQSAQMERQYFERKEAPTRACNEGRHECRRHSKEETRRATG